MSSEPLRIVVQADGTRTVMRELAQIGATGERTANGVKRSMDGVGQSFRGAATAVDFFKRALAALGIAKLVSETYDLLNAYSQIENRLRTVTSGQQELARVTREVFAVSKDARLAVGDVAELYTRLSNATSELGVSQGAALRLTQGLAQATQLGGSTAAESSGAMRQLTQALGSGRLQGQELNSILEQMPILAVAIADSLGVTRGALKQLGKEGKLTTDVVLNAIERALPEWERRFRELPVTPRQAFTQLKNELTKAVGQFDLQTSASDRLVGTIQRLADNSGLVTRALIGLSNASIQLTNQFNALTGGGLSAGEMLTFMAQNSDRLAIALGTYLALQAIPRLISALAALRVATLANPWTALFTGLAAGVAYLNAFGDEIGYSQDKLVSMSDVGTAAWQVLNERIASGLRMLQSDYGEEINFLRKSFGELSGVWNNIDLSPQALLGNLASAADMVFNLVRSSARALDFFWDQFKKAGWNAMVDLKEMIEELVNSMIRAINSKLNEIQARGGALANLLPEDIGSPNFSLGQARRYTTRDANGGLAPVSLGSAFNDAKSVFDFSMNGQGQSTYFRDAAAQVNQLAALIAQQRQLMSQSQQLAAGANQLLAQVQQFSQSSLQLQGVIKNGTAEQKAQAAALLDQGTQQLRNASLQLGGELKQVITSAGALVASDFAKLSQQAGLLKELSEATSQAVNEAKITLVSAATTIGSQTGIAFLNAFRLGIGGAVAQAAGAALGAFAGPAAGAAGAASGGTATPSPQMQQYLQNLDKLQNQIDGVLRSTQQIGPISSSAFDQAGKAAKGFGDQFGNVGGIFQNIFSGLENALVSFVTTGKLDFKQLINSILADLARMVVQMLIIRPLMGFFGGLFGFSGGGFVGGFGSGGLIPGFAVGGVVGDFKSLPGFAAGGGIGRIGGVVQGYGGPTDDNILARLSPGEFIVNAASTRAYLPLLRAINDGASLMQAGGLSQFATGGIVGAFSGFDRMNVLSGTSGEAFNAKQSAEMTRMVATQVRAISESNQRQKGGNGSSVVVNAPVTVNVTSQGNADADGAAIGRAANRQIVSQLQEWLINEKRPGGLLSDSKVR